MIVLSELAETARIPVDELRARLNHAGIGASGSGNGWESKVRSLVDEIAKENGGVIGGQVVAPYAIDNDRLIMRAEVALNTRVRKAFQAIELNDGSSLEAQERIRQTPFKTWFTQENAVAPSPWQLFIAVPNDCHPKILEAIAALPDFIDGFEVCHFLPGLEVEDA